jgi:hypothetical protein
LAISLSRYLLQELLTPPFVGLTDAYVTRSGGSWGALNGQLGRRLPPETDVGVGGILFWAHNA